MIDPRFYARYLRNPPSLTSTDEARRNEAEDYISYATKGLMPSTKVLLVGAGDGHELVLLERKGFKNTCGISSHFEEGLKKQHHNLKVADLHDMPVGLSRYDFCMSKETLEHLLSPYVALFQLNKAMNKGAKFCHLIPSGPEKQRDWYHLNCVPPWVWVDWFRKTGFRVDRVEKAIEQYAYWGEKVHEAEDYAPECYNLEDELKRLGLKV
jgi:hypothetical protein